MRATPGALCYIVAGSRREINVHDRVAAHSSHTSVVRVFLSKRSPIRDCVFLHLDNTQSRQKPLQRTAGLDHTTHSPHTIISLQVPLTLNKIARLQIRASVGTRPTHPTLNFHRTSPHYVRSALLHLAVHNDHTTFPTRPPPLPSSRSAFCGVLRKTCWLSFVVHSQERCPTQHTLKNMSTHHSPFPHCCCSSPACVESNHHPICRRRSTPEKNKYQRCNIYCFNRTAFLMQVKLNYPTGNYMIQRTNKTRHAHKPQEKLPTPRSSLSFSCGVKHTEQNTRNAHMRTKRIAINVHKNTIPHQKIR